MSRPPLPPRRSVPPPQLADTGVDDDDDQQPKGIAARIARLQLDHKGIGRGQVSQSSPVPRGALYPTSEELARRGPDFLRLIRRPPPPIPPLTVHKAPPPPPRRLPARLPTPPPEPVPEPELEASCLKCHDFSYVDAHAAQFPRQTVSSLDQLAIDLTSPFDSETEKCRAIFTWLHHNVAYDTVSFFSGKLATCDRPSNLPIWASSLRRSYKVTGHGKGFGYAATGPDAPVPPYQSNHAWNCVLMDGEWRLIDCCWGAGALEGSVWNKCFTPTWFSSSPVEFGRRHYPEDPSYQLISEEDGGPVSWEQYILEPERPVIFQDFYKLNFNPYLLQPAEKYIQSGAWATFHIFKFCEHMSRADADNYVYFISDPGNTRTPMQVNEEGGWSATVYIPRGGGELSLYYVTQCDGRDAKGLSVQAFNNANGRKAMSFGGMGRWTVV
ncbi:uncharacterized protein EV420DRAFT_1640569 [Desarmillaria tabescens]|uniref:Transglutaminase-like domain-containing protein n=1 Tax=Armillaria tabescens TaxID=1929756 RepID=A0AA39TR31_ARMTA|nr:uncharacterized protein EV420DRAFT_1640569 [Desarmillaria tabescens]KAK0461069.1 hypothetical protein EV420DRAFT_1640569 [Desarmillaria tabescens]